MFLFILINESQNHHTIKEIPQNKRQQTKQENPKREEKPNKQPTKPQNNIITRIITSKIKQILQKNNPITKR